MGDESNTVRYNSYFQMIEQLTNRKYSKGKLGAILKSIGILVREGLEKDHSHSERLYLEDLQNTLIKFTKKKGKCIQKVHAIAYNAKVNTATEIDTSTAI